DLAGENIGVVPSPEWKRKRSRENWYPGETVNAGIGQGYWIATVLQLVRGTGAIANGGELHRLHLVDDRRDGYDQPWTPLPQPVPVRITDNANNLRAVQEGMIATVHGGGTGAAMARGAPYMMAGKTGTAQKISRKGSQSFDPHSLPYHLRHQALFVGYAPAENPTIAIAVSVEHGGFGGTAAAPIARKVFDAWLLGKMPEPVEGVTRSPQGGVLMVGRAPPLPANTTPALPVGASAAGTTATTTHTATSTSNTTTSGAKAAVQPPGTVAPAPMTGTQAPASPPASAPAAGNEPQPQPAPPSEPTR
ncbi:MAG TPA: penicillin-binding transpeptidase domain-containing protein, partial [Lysobacter sp.]|nr:penicillin-binding transpeptidase domain-containing protein [Lysobacter sp.]